MLAGSQIMKTNSGEYGAIKDIDITVVPCIKSCSFELHPDESFLLRF